MSLQETLVAKVPANRPCFHFILPKVLRINPPEQGIAQVVQLHQTTTITTLMMTRCRLLRWNSRTRKSGQKRRRNNGGERKRRMVCIRFPRRTASLLLGGVGRQHSLR